MERLTLPKLKWCQHPVHSTVVFRIQAKLLCIPEGHEHLIYSKSRSRRLLQSSVIVCGLLLATTSRLNAATLWSIYWTSAWMPCGDGVMLLSSPPHKLTEGTLVSIAQRVSNDSTPWGRKLPITIIGYSIIHEVKGETGQQTWMLVGSASGRPGADVFAMTAGQGNSSSALMFPPGVGLPHLGRHPDAHFDVYGSCSGVEQRGLVSIFYTSP